MAGAGDIGGNIRVRLSPQGGVIGAVDIVSTRPVAAARVFEGKPVDEVTGGIGRVFSLCAVAQTVAALRAGEQALRLAPAPGVEAARDLARLAEMLTQTTMRLALHWPRVLGLDIRPDLVRACLVAQRTIEAQALGPGWRRPGAGVQQPGAGLAEALTALEHALAEGDPGPALAAELARRGLEGYGALPPGQAPEQGALARRWEAPRVSELRAAHGAGLAARLAASREEYSALPHQMRGAMAAIRPARARGPLRLSGAGVAKVETVRGPLRHVMKVENGIVTGCRTEAPTEENFSPQGPVAAGLLGAAADVTAAELHVLAIDPCVACSIEMSGPEPGPGSD